jgi:hypothetical protein
MVACFADVADFIVAFTALEFVRSFLVVGCTPAFNLLRFLLIVDAVATATFSFDRGTIFRPPSLRL